MNVWTKGSREDEKHEIGPGESSDGRADSVETHDEFEQRQHDTSLKCKQYW